ncbi:MAG: serine hydrolase [Desulfurococcaceae archaeon TW002]
MSLTTLENFIQERLTKYRFPGVSIALLRGNEVIYSRGFGFRDITESLPTTPNTNYCIGSVTKAFTAAAIMQLVEKGLISLEDPANKFIDVIKSSDIKVYHLLSHTSGIPALGYAEALIDSYYGLGDRWFPIATPDDVISFMRDYDEWLIHKPGERWFYLNEGYVLLGKIIEKVSGMSYESYVKVNLLDKLGMRRSYFSRDEYLRDNDRATPYLINKEGKHIKAEPVFGISADGGLFSNVIDLLKFAEALINRGSRDNVEILSKDSVTLMEKAFTQLPYETPLADSYGLGLIIRHDFFGHKLVGHSGSVLVYTAYVGYVPDKKIGVAILANASGYPLSLIGGYALAILLGKNPEKELSYVLTERIYEKLVGTYKNYKETVRMCVKKSGDMLFLESSRNSNPVPLVPEKISEEYALFKIYTLATKIPVEFYVKDSKIVMIYDRYELIKSS